MNLNHERSNTVQEDYFHHKGIRYRRLERSNPTEFEQKVTWEYMNRAYDRWDSAFRTSISELELEIAYNEWKGI